MVVTAQGASEGEFRSVRRMLDLERAPLLARALGKFADFLARDVVAVALPLVAGFAEVGISPAEPLRDGAAEFALKLDEVESVLLATGIT